MLQPRYQNEIRNILFIENDDIFYDPLRNEIESGLSKCQTYTCSKENLPSEDANSFGEFDLVVFDYSDKLKDYNLLNRLQLLSTKIPFSLIIICSELDKKMILDVLAKDSKGCLYKGDDIQDLKDFLLSSFFSNYVIISTQIFEYLLHVSPTEYFIKRFSYRLTEREAGIVVMLQCGNSNKEIAEKLSVAIGTVNQSLNNIYNKLNVNSRGELMSKLFI